MKHALYYIESFLENLNKLRDRLLFAFLKQHWPRKITPNHLSYARLGIGVALFIFLFILGIENKALIVSLFFIGIFSDLLDGSLARATNQMTTFGAILYPTADRVLIIPIAVYSLLSTSAWLLLFLIITETVNALFSLYYNSREIYLESNILGKTKMVILSVVFVGILFFFPASPQPIFIAALWLTIPISFLSIYSKILDLRKSYAK